MTTPATKITVPSSLLDSSLHHQVYLGRYSTTVVNNIVGLLNDMDKDLIDLIKKKGEVKNFTTERLNALLTETEKLTKEAAAVAASTATEQLASFAQHEASWNSNILKTLTGGQLDIVTPTAEHLAALVSDQPFQGALLNEWFTKLGADKQHVVTQATRLGFAEGETIDQITRRLTGSKAAGYADGALEIPRRHAEAVVRTSVNHTANASQQLVFKQNEDLIQGWVFVATLDGRTTVTCGSLSGTKWPTGEGPIPPRHFRCRSFAMPLIKTWKELGINIDEIPLGTRAAIGGPVNADLSFSEWLKGQPTKIQDDMLGKTRAELFRKGGLTVDKFTDNMGNVLTLDELKGKEAEAFKNVFGSKDPTGSGGGHLGKTIPVTGPMDFSHILNQNLSPAAVAEVEKAKAAQAAAEAKVSAKKEYMAKYNAAKKEAAAASKATAEAEAKAMAEVKAAQEAAAAAEQLKQEEALVNAYKEKTVKGEFLTVEESVKFGQLSKAVQEQAVQDAKLMKATAEAQVKKMAEAQLAFEKAALEQEHLGQGLLQLNAEQQSIIQGMSQSEYLDLMGNIQTKIKAQQTEKAALQAATEDQAKKWQMYKAKIKKQLLDGKDLSPAFQKTLDAVPQAEKDKFMAQITKQAVAAPAKPVAGLFAEEKYTKAIIEMGGNNMKFWMPYLDVAGQGELAILAKAKQLGMSEASGSWEKLKAAIEAAKGNTKALYDLADKYGPGSAIGQGAVKAINVLKAETLAAPELKAKIADVAEHKLDFKNMEKLEAKKGSNEGGLFLDKSTGQKWYIKTPASADQAINEVTANGLYRLAGVNVPETLYIEVEGRMSIASKWVEGIEKGTPASLAKAAGTMDGFAVDSWLANWDVVGLSHDNLLLQGGRAIRIDNGGSLLYRAQGTAKGSAFGNFVEELNSLRNATDNKQAASVFSKITQKELEASVSKVLAIADKDIIATIEKYGAQWTAAERKQLADTLIARKADLAAKFPNLVKVEKAAALPADASARVTKAELKMIEDARANGYVMSTDKDSIEDHHVLIWQEKNVNGEMVTKARLKVIGNTFATLNKEVAKTGARAVAESTIKGLTVEINDSLSAKIIETIKGVASQAASGGDLREKDIQRAKEAVDLWNSIRMKILGSDGKPAMDHYSPWMDRIRAVANSSIGDKAMWNTAGPKFEGFVVPTTVPKATGVSPWVADTYKFQGSTFNNGHIQKTNNIVNSMDNLKQIYTRDINGVKISFWDGKNVFAVQGTVELELTGTGQKAVEELFKAMEQMGVNSARSTALDREELYLRQIAYHRNSKLDTFNTGMANLTNQAERVKWGQQWLSKEIGSDITLSKTYNPGGLYQAFGQGRVNMMRPDLEGAAWDAFAKDYRLAHRHTSNGTLAEVIDKILGSGGQMAPSTDKLRRGLPLGGMSPEQDLQTGGANYFFTRIKKATDVSDVGFYWHPDAVKRLDSISYDGDKYGRTTGTTVRDNRKTGIEQWKQAAGHSSNETIFKNSLSMFDGLDQIKAGSAANRDEIINVFKKHGYTKFPDGRALTDVIKA